MADSIDSVSDWTISLLRKYMSLMVDFLANFGIRISPSDYSKIFLLPYATEATLSSERMIWKHLIIVESFRKLLFITFIFSFLPWLNSTVSACACWNPWPVPYFKKLFWLKISVLFVQKLSSSVALNTHHSIDLFLDLLLLL